MLQAMCGVGTKQDLTIEFRHHEIVAGFVAHQHDEIRVLTNDTLAVLKHYVISGEMDRLRQLNDTSVSIASDNFVAELLVLFPDATEISTAMKEKRTFRAEGFDILSIRVERAYIAGRTPCMLIQESYLACIYRTIANIWMIGKVQQGICLVWLNETAHDRAKGFRQRKIQVFFWILHHGRPPARVRPDSLCP